MQKAELVLTILNQKSKEDSEYNFKRLYRNLFNPDLYLNAYAKIYSKEGNMTEGIDNKTIDGFNMNTINNLIEKLRYERYNPEPVRRKYIPKKNGGERPLGIPTFEDKLVQEVIKQILEAIYEPLFCNTSHGFRSNRSCHTALERIKKSCSGCSWIIEGDIKGFFDNINHDKMLEILEGKIKDGRFINLINKFLKAGIMEEGKIKDSITGAPQGGIVSPVLSNIYLNELDKFMEYIKSKKEIGKSNKDNKEYHRLSNARQRNIAKGEFKEAKKILKQMRKIPANDPMNQEFIRIHYIRYADDFVILIKGAKSFAEEIKQNVKEFIDEKLNLTLSPEKTLITNLLKGKARFLGYEITKGIENTKLVKSCTGVKRRSVNGKIQLLVPVEVIRNKIKPFTKKGKPVHVKGRLNRTIAEMISIYNSEIRGLYNFYRLAGNVSKRLGTYKYYHYYSLVKTLAFKHKMSVRKTIKRFGIAVHSKLGTGTINIIGTKYTKKNGEEKTLTYFNDSLKKSEIVYTEDILPETGYRKNYKNEIVRRLLNGYCELCDKEIIYEHLSVHHVRSLKKLKEKYNKKNGNMPNWVKLMIKIRRKTLVVCNNCHNIIHR